MTSFHDLLTRRNFIRTGAALSTVIWSPSMFADELTVTPQLTEGPFYPDQLPLDTDNDLLVINDSLTPAVGEITHLTGRVLTASGSPVRNAFVEIWQVDNNGAYLNRNDSQRDRADTNFQGYGRFLTDSKGQYYFRTIKPVPYPGRTPHIHVGVSRNGQRIYTTQLFINGHPQNEMDGIFQAVREPAPRKTLLVDFLPLEGSKLGELRANFDIVMGVTPEDEQSPIKGGIGKPQWQGFGRPRRG